MRWEVKPLGEVCDIQNGFAFKSKDYSESGARVIRIGNVQKGIIGDKSPRFMELNRLSEFSRFQIHENDILISLTGDVGRVGQFPVHLLPALLNQRVGRFENIDSSSINSEFLFQVLNSDWFEKLVIESSEGAAQMNSSTKKIKGISIPIPPLEEQERIVEVLDEAFAAIDKAKANIERNLTNARELFQSRLNDIFSNPFEDWEVKPLGEVCTFKSGGTPSKSKPQLWGDGIPWISSKDMKSDSILETQDSVTLEAVGQGTRAVKPGTLLIVVRSGILMRKIPIALTGVDATFNQDIKALIVNSELSSEFLFWFLKGSEPTLLTLVTRSATVHRLETSVLTSFQIPIPESQEQEAIVKTASLLNRLKKKLETKYLTELDNLEELRQSILEQAFEGKLTEPVAA